MQLPSLSSLLSYVPKLYHPRVYVHRSMVNEIAAVPPFTPDLALLQGQEHHLLFDYGQRLDLDKVSDAFTHNRLCLWNRRDKDKTGISAVAFKCKGQHNTSVHGRLYTVRIGDLIKLDNQRLNGLLFRRKRVNLQLPMVDVSSKVRGGTQSNVAAWTYLGVPARWEGEIDWDTQFYKGYGEYRKADIFPANEELRQYQVKDHYKYQPFFDQYIPAVFPHIRPPGVHKHVKDIDRQHEKNQVRRDNRIADRQAVNNNKKPSLIIQLNELHNR